MVGVGGAVAQAMRGAGCPNRRSLSLSDVFPPFVSRPLVAVVAGGMVLLRTLLRSRGFRGNSRCCELKRFWTRFFMPAGLL